METSTAQVPGWPAETTTGPALGFLIPRKSGQLVKTTPDTDGDFLAPATSGGPSVWLLASGFCEWHQVGGGRGEAERADAVL